MTLSAPSGEYRVTAAPLTLGGRFYAASRTKDELVVKGGGTAAKLAIAYELRPEVRDFHALRLTSTGVTLTWTSTRPVELALRRTAGATPARTKKDGLAVPVTKGSATDSGLQPGTRYTYALFVEAGGKEFGPLTLQVSTASTDPTAATYVANPQALILAAADIVTATTTGSGRPMTEPTAYTYPGVPPAKVAGFAQALANGVLPVVPSAPPALLPGRTAGQQAGRWALRAAISFSVRSRPLHWCSRCTCQRCSRSPWWCPSWRSPCCR